MLASTLAVALGITSGAAMPSALAGEAAGDTVVLKVDRVYTGSGTDAVPGPIVISDGKIVRIGGEVPKGARVVDYSGMSACAGFIDALTALGGSFDEPARSVMTTLNARESFDPFHDAFDDAAKSGVISVGLSPSSANLIGGLSAVVRTCGESADAVYVGEGPLRMALSSAALRPVPQPRGSPLPRKPTSRMGALHLLRAEVKAGLPGSGGLLIEANSADEIRLALATISSTGRKVTLVRPRLADHALTVLEGSGASVILGPFGISSSSRELRFPQVLDGIGVPVAFTANGDGTVLRRSAALAARSGMDPAAALAAITSVPASILGLADTGSLQPGKRADLLIFDGHPLDLSAALEAVYCGGVWVELED